MARKPMVTRTFDSTKVTALCLDITNEEPCNKEFILPRTFKDEKTLMKKLKSYETDDLKIVHVVKQEVEHRLYGMEESKFIELAEILPPRGTKEEQ